MRHNLFISPSSSFGEPGAKPPQGGFCVSLHHTSLKHNDENQHLRRWFQLLPGKFARVIKTEEKGSDVNIATHLLMDGFRNAYELAVVVSNDSDLLMPIKVVMGDLQKPVGILMPARQGHPSQVLTAQVTFVKKIRERVLEQSQFGATLLDKMGNFGKPASW